MTLQASTHDVIRHQSTLRDYGSVKAPALLPAPALPAAAYHAHILLIDAALSAASSPRRLPPLPTSATPRQPRCESFPEVERNCNKNATGLNFVSKCTDNGELPLKNDDLYCK